MPYISDEHKPPFPIMKKKTVKQVKNLLKYIFKINK